MLTGETQSHRVIGLLGRYNPMEGTCVGGGEGLEELLEVRAGEEAQVADETFRKVETPVIQQLA